MYTLGEMAAHFRRAAVQCHSDLEVIVEIVAVSAAGLARSYVGHPQEEWAPLSPRTIYGFRMDNGRYIVGKEARGFDEGQDFEPLHGDEGLLRDSIFAWSSGLEGFVGSNEKRALYQEMGTPGARYPIPPRPLFAKAMKEASAEVEIVAGELALNLLAPEV